MGSEQRKSLPWQQIGRPLEELLRYEKKIGHYEHAAYALLSSMVHGTDRCPWRAYLLHDENFAAVARYILTICQRECSTPNDVLREIRQLVESAPRHNPQTAQALLSAYLEERPNMPTSSRQCFDERFLAGETAIPRRAAALAREIEKLRPCSTQGDAERQVFAYWFQQIVDADTSEAHVRSIPSAILDVTEKLLAHLGNPSNQQPNEHVPPDRETVYERYRRVFEARDIEALADLVIAAEALELSLDVDAIERFLENLSFDDALQRFKRLAQWMKEVNQQNHDGVHLTPRLAKYLAEPSDFESLLGEVERLREETRHGRFKIDNVLQRDLEFTRFSAEYSWQEIGKGRSSDRSSMFEQLGKLPPPREASLTLSEEHIAHLKRVAYEAVGFLRFLQTFRNSSRRPIVVVGNDRYGRQWVVEPLEDHLKDDFILRYDRSPSHMSMRLKVRHELRGNIRLGFPRDFVKQMNQQMPHIVIVDCCSPKKDDTIMWLSRGSRDYVNWFMAFNDLRAEGDGSSYEADSSLPTHHFPELRKWHEYERVKRQLRDWVTLGSTYAIAHWTPTMKENVLLGDFKVRRRDPNLSSNRPQVVVANPGIYSSNNVPEELRDSRSYYFDGPEQYAKERVVFGFGTHGFETRIEGVTTDTFVAAVQRQIKVEIDRILAQAS